ncbi:MAG: T9SS type A sorting domain-containing protein [Saprospiraceae bacterium]|nr:T9SS type A sorting domain-containing protein [Candidatus Brachybacter algidus]
MAFIPNQWNLVELAAEVMVVRIQIWLYPEYWLDTLGIYCPWSGQIAREIQNPSEVNENNFLSSIVAFPNPASEFLTIETNSNSVLIASIYNSIGVKVLNGIVVIKHKRINLETIEDGIYFIRISTQRTVPVKINRNPESKIKLWDEIR